MYVFHIHVFVYAEETVGTLLLHLTDDVSRDGGVKVDGVVSKPLRAFVAFTTPALEGLANANLSAMPVLGVVFDTIHILKQKEAIQKPLLYF